MTKRIEQLAVDLIARGEKFKAELASSQGDAERWGKRVSAGIGKGTTALAIAGAAAASLTVKTIRLADEIAKNSRTAGIATDTYQRWEFAASQSGVSNEKFASSLERATKRIGEAARGFGGAKKTLDEYNISVFDAEGNIRSTEAVVRDFSNRLSEMSTAQERTAAVTALFGREGARMALLLGQGTEALSEFEAQADRLGLVIDRGILEKAEQANDKFDIMERILKARLISSLGRLFPTVIELGNAFASATPKVIEFSDAVLNLASNSNKARIQNTIRANREQIKVLKQDLELIDVGALTSASPLARDAFDPLGQFDLSSPDAQAIAKQKIEESINFRKRQIDKLYSELTAYETQIRKRSADLINPENLLIGSGAGGSAAGKTFEELQAEAAEEANRRRLQSMTDLSTGYLDRTNALYEASLIRGMTIEELNTEAAERAYQRRIELLEEFSENYLDRTQELIDKENERQQKQLDVQREIRDAKLQMAEDSLGALASLAKEDSKLQRILLAAQKVVALNKARIALQEAVAKANALGFPQNIPAIAQAVSIGAGAIATIKGINVSGVAHAGLQNVPREGTYLLDRGERVVSPRQNQDLTAFLRKQNSSPNIQVVFHQHGGVIDSDVREERGPNGEIRLLVEQTVRQVFTEDVQSGRGIEPMFREKYGLVRRGAR